MSKLWKILSLLLAVPQIAAAVDVVVIAPQADDYQEFGRELADGVQIAAADINAAGGVLGQKVNVIVADDRCDDVFAVSMAQMLSVRENKPKLIIGPYCQNKVTEAASVYAQGQMWQIVPVPLDEKNAAVDMVGLRSQQAQIFFDYYQQNLAGQNTALVYPSNDKNLVSIAAAIQQNFTAGGQANRLTGYDLLNYGKDYELMAREILLNNQAVYILGSPKTVAKLTRELKAQNENIKIFAERAVVGDTYKEILGNIAVGCYYLGLKSFQDSPYFTETLVRLRLQGKEPKGLGIYGFAALKLWAETAGRAGSFDYNQLKKFAAGTYAMPWGDDSFGVGKNKQQNLYGVFQKNDQEYTQVY